MSLLSQQAAARSSSRRKKKTSPPPLEPALPAPAGVVKTSPSGKRYRVLTIPLMDLPAFLEKNNLEPKTYFYYPPESDWFLGVRKKEKKILMSLDKLVIEVRRAWMLEVFREALPEIAEDSEIVFVQANPWKGPDGEVDLKKYDIPGPYPTRLEFTIAYLPEAKRVLVLRSPPEELPEELKIAEVYIKQYVPKEGSPPHRTPPPPSV